MKTGVRREVVLRMPMNWELEMMEITATSMVAMMRPKMTTRTSMAIKMMII